MNFDVYILQAVICGGLVCITFTFVVFNLTTALTFTYVYTYDISVTYCNHGFVMVSSTIMGCSMRD